MEPLVSIVIPVFNHGRYVAEAIESVLAQDYPHIEVIAIDDGSTDDTKTVLARYSKRLHTETQPNIGQSATLNKGWAMSKGTILGYLNADDTLTSTAVSESVELLNAHPDVIATYPDYELIGPDSSVIRSVKAPEFSYRRMVTQFILPPGPGAFFRREVLEEAGGWDTGLQQMPDYDFWLRAGRLGEIRRIPRVLATFRVHHDSLTFSPADNQRSDEPIRILEAFFREDPPPELRDEASRALSRAHVVAARAHLRAGRYGSGIRRVIDSLQINWRGVMSRYGIRLIISGLVGRMAYIAAWPLARMRSVFRKNESA